MRAIVQAFKYGRHQTLGAALVEHLVDHLPLDLRGIDAVVPVPLHPWRRVSRGFNQAERLARHLGPPVLHALVRWAWTPAQATLPAAARHVNVRQAFSIAPRMTAAGRHILRARLTGARILLVDDVVTTGSTLSACARVLRQAGAKEVHALAVARAE